MYDRYFSYLARHKFYTFIECCKLGIPLRGLLHDLSKFLPSEFIPYAHHFYGQHAEIDKDYDFAWLQHIHRNMHHWQYYIIIDLGIEEILPMPDEYRKEMLADWIGAGYAKNQPDVKDWYLKNKQFIRLHPETTRWVESRLGIV